MKLSRDVLYRLDWIKILDRAIKNRPSSWSQNPIYEWRNASDEICYSVMNALEEKGLVEESGLVKAVKEMKKTK